jgi:hypothetical protein
VEDGQMTRGINSKIEGDREYLTCMLGSWHAFRVPRQTY